MALEKNTDLQSWKLPVTDVASQGTSFSRQATQVDCDELAGRLGIVACKSLTLDVLIAPLHRGRYRVSGMLHARVIQSCIVSLDPVEQAIDEPVDVEFWPPDQISVVHEGEHEIVDGDDPEPIEAGFILLGRLVFEIVSASLDPYPRLPDAELEQSESPPRGTMGTSGPFAELARLKSRK
ncbi:MAG: hypothetical protein RLZ98_556 [Pseudomonadota bacterium]|jgi:hypothetical protein